MLNKFLGNKKVFTISALVVGLFLGAIIQGIATTLYTVNEFNIKNMDVLSNVRIVNTKVENGVRMLELVGQKNRNDCGAPIKLSGYYGDPLTPFDTVETRKRFLQIQQDIPVEQIAGYSARPGIIGQDQNFGWWVVIPDPVEDFYLYIDYLCGQDETPNNPYLKRTILGPYNIREVENQLAQK